MPHHNPNIPQLRDTPLAATKDNVAAAQSDYNLAKQHPVKLSGLVIHDPSVRPISYGIRKGQQVRPLLSDEIHAHMAQDPTAPAYIRMTNPDRTRAETMSSLRADRPAASSATGKPYTGAAAKVGGWTPGHRSMADSQLHDTTMIGTARMEQNFLNRFGLRDANGNHFTPQNVGAEAKQYNSDHPNTPVTPVVARAAGADKLTLVPKASLDELKAQMKLENPKAAASGMVKLTRGFRNSVLPTSGKLLVMHPTEMGVRGALAHVNPLDVLRARSVLKTMDKTDPVAANRLRDLNTPGGVAGGMAKLDAEDVGHGGGVLPSMGKYLGGEPGARVGQTLNAPARAWGAVAHKIIGFQRSLVKPTEYGVLGAHMRQTLQDMGHSWLDANTAVSRYSDALAKGYATPQMAEAAAQKMHPLLGQYTNLNARQRFIVSRGIAPFSPWYLNAAKLVWRGLPGTHPLKTTLLTDLAHTNSPQWKALHAGMPSDMQDFASMGPGHWLDFGKLVVCLVIGGCLGYDEACASLHPRLLSATSNDPSWKSCCVRTLRRTVMSNALACC